MKCELKYMRKDLKDFAIEFSKGRKLLFLIIISMCTIVFSLYLNHIIIVEETVELKTVNLILMIIVLILIGFMYFLAKIRCEFKKEKDTSTPTTKLTL